MAALEANGLTPQQEEAIYALLQAPTVKKAAEAIGMGERTLYRWMDMPAFKEAYRKARREAFKHAISITQRYAPLAIQTLAKVMTDEKSTSASKVSAAEAILKFSRDSVELDDLEGRIEDLEAAAKSTSNGSKPSAPTPIPPAPPEEPEGPMPMSDLEEPDAPPMKEAA